ncbi:MAG: AbrB/MazE/SpoVT family DNA-binding domain-containing protein [Patescibacteria group bacterium UBA2163]
MKTVKVGQRGVITLPKKIREALGVGEGGILAVREQNGTLVLEPHGASSDPVLADIRAGLEDIKRGNFIEFSNLEEFDEKVDSYEDSTGR